MELAIVSREALKTQFYIILKYWKALMDRLFELSGNS